MVDFISFQKQQGAEFIKSHLTCFVNSYKSVLTRGWVVTNFAIMEITIGADELIL